jgi:hypothetical protein
MKNDILINKQITEMPKLDFNINELKIFYCVLQKKIREFFDIETAYEYESFDWDNIDEYRLEEIIEEEVIVNMQLLKRIFKGNKSFSEMANKIRKMPLKAEYESYYDEYGNRLKEKALIIIPIFEEIRIYKRHKEIGFKLEYKMIKYITNLEKFSRINIDNIINLTTKYEVRLYEYICENCYYDNKGNKNISDESRKIKSDKFIKYFEIPETYKTNNIDQKFINPAILGLYNKIDIKVNIVKLKLDNNDKKKVSHYRIDVIK